MPFWDILMHHPSSYLRADSEPAPGGPGNIALFKPTYPLPLPSQKYHAGSGLRTPDMRLELQNKKLKQELKNYQNAK
jgi:hypothetical protein